MGMLLAEGMERMFGLDAQLLFDSGLTLLAVFILFLVASNFLFNPVRKMLDSRKKRIEDDLTSAQNEKEAAEKMRAEYEAKIKDTDKEVERILAEARKKALDQETKIVADAREEAAGIIKRAQEEALLEKKKVADEMKQEMIAVASLMAGKVVSKNIDTTIQDSLVEETLKEIGDSTWLS